MQAYGAGGVFQGLVLARPISAGRPRARSVHSLLDIPTYFAAQNFQAPVPTYYNTLESCLTYNACDLGSEVTWCIHMYHPTEDITICLNESGVINETDYSKLLQLQCYFSVPSVSSIFVHAPKCLVPET